MKQPLTVERLIERAEIIDVLAYQFCQGVDTADWPLYRSAFTEEVYADFYDPNLKHVPKPKVMKSDDWIAFCASVMNGFDATQHNLNNFIFNFESDGTVTVKAYVISEHHLGNDNNSIGGQYTFKFKRTDQGWKCFNYGVRTIWQKGNQALFEQAMARVRRGEGRNGKKN